MLPPILANLRIPVVASPMFIVSGPELVIAQCKAGIVGSFPALNAREKDGEPPLLDAWLAPHAATPLAAALDSRWLNGLGVVTHKPVTEDYVPLLPWLGVLLLGVAAGQTLPRAALAWPVGRLGHGLAALGRWSLSYYMLHQLVLIGALVAWMHGLR